jgi:hypothetical protein
MLYSHIEEEIYNSSLELIKLHEKHPILHTVTNFSDFKNLQSQLPQEQPAQVLPALETKTTFEAGFTFPQIELLTQCVNEARVFTETITSEIFENILSCTLALPLKSRNNRLLVYFFSSLDDRSLINRYWQIVIDKNQFHGKSLVPAL